MKKVLFVDDDPNVLSAFQRLLRKQFEVETALGPELGLAAVKNGGAYAVVVADMNMPGMDGVEFLSQIKVLAPQTIRIMLTGNVDQATATGAVNEGSVFRFLNKPCTSEELAVTLRAALRQHELVAAEHELLEKTLKGCLETLTEMLSLVAPNIFHQSERLTGAMQKLAAVLKVEHPWELEAAARLFQLGYAAIPPAVVLKSRSGKPLSGDELAMLERVPEIGHHLLAHIPRLEGVAQIILYQNKNFDGSGFPLDTVARDKIPLGARLLRILTDLSSRAATDHPAGVLDFLRTNASRYDPQLLELVIQHCGEEISPVAPGVNPAPPAPRALKLSELQPGLRLAADIVSQEGFLIIGSGNRITPALLERLRNFSASLGVKEPVYVDPPSTPFI